MGQESTGQGERFGKGEALCKAPRGGRLSSIPLGTPARQVCSWERRGKKKKGEKKKLPP